jgi:hypothetical protein
MSLDASTANVSLTKYLWQFLGAYVVCILLIAAITYFLNFEAPSAIGMVALIASASPAGQTFVRTNNRAMTTGERARFALLATVASMLLSLLMILGALAASGLPLSVAGFGEMMGFPEMDSGILSIILGVGIVVSWVVIYFALGFIGRSTLKQMAKGKLKPL